MRLANEHEAILEFRFSLLTELSVSNVNIGTKNCVSWPDIASCSCCISSCLWTSLCLYCIKHAHAFAIQHSPEKFAKRQFYWAAVKSLEISVERNWTFAVNSISSSLSPFILEFELSKFSLSFSPLLGLLDLSMSKSKALSRIEQWTVQTAFDCYWNWLGAKKQ